MHCNSVRDTLLDFLNGETTSFRAWMIRRHLAACADCAAELASVQRFQESLRRADVVPPEPVPAFVSTRRAPLRRTLAAALAAVLIGGLFLLPSLNQSRRNTQNPGAAIAAALGRVNTWHFVGWKQIDGKQVPWEVWGSRKPWLYYERVGDTITWDDGKRCLRLFAPNPALKRPQGLLIKASADQVDYNFSFLNDPAYQILVSDGRSPFNFSSDIRLYAQTSTVAKYRFQNYRGMSGINENKLYTVSKRDWLPTTYQLHFENPKIARDTEYLQVHYGDELPDAVVNPPTANDYSVIDFTQTATEAAASSGSHIAESHGFQVQAEPVGMDKEGNVLIAVRGWLGGNRLLKDTTFTLNVSPFQPELFTAKRGTQAIKYLSASDSSVAPGDSLYLPFMPLDVIQALPDTLAFALSASPEVRVRDSDQIDVNGGIHPMTTTESLFTANFHWTLPLPRMATATLSAVLPSVTSSDFRLPSEYDRAQMRVSYYLNGSDYFYTALWQAAPSLARTGVINPNGTLSPNLPAWVMVEAVRKAHPQIFQKAKQEFRERAVYWQKRKLALLPTGGSTHEERENNLVRHLNDVQLLAVCYQEAGDTANCNKTLRQLIRECQPLPEQGGLLRRQAEFALRTGQFPGDADYKGPS
jgi:hypothetical protein